MDMSNAKNKNLILYICERASQQKDFGATKLNKALWFSDMIHYLKTGSFISSFKYVRQDQGPTPDPSAFLSLRRSMIHANEFKYEPIDYFGRTLHKCQNVAEPDKTYFNELELEVIDKTIDDISSLSGSQLSEMTHNLGWDKTSNGEEMTPKHFITTHEKLTSTEVDFLLDSYKV
jgi:hypothetical protein